MSGFVRIGNQLFDPITGEPAGWTDPQGRERGYIGLWANRPSAALMPVGSTITITDVPAGGRSQWYSDGTNWRPVGGSVVLYNRAGSLNAPVASLTWAGAAILAALPGGSIKVPAGMLVAGQSMLQIDVLFNLGAGNTGGMNCQTVLGKTNSFSDSQLSGQFTGANQDVNAFHELGFPTTTTCGGNHQGTGFAIDPTGKLGLEYNTNIDTTVDQYINIGTASGSTVGNVMKIVKVCVRLFQ